MEGNIKIQDNLLQRISNARGNFKKSPKERLKSDDYLSTRLQMLEDSWSQFNTIHNQIVLDTDSDVLEASAYFKDDVYNETEELYIDYKCELKAALRKLTPTIESTSVTQTATGISKSNIKLPEITIPKFSGKYAEWTTFRDLFIALVHKNVSLDNVQRLHYLKSHLSGEAEQLLRHVDITQENYSKCWEQLEKRYNNKKYLANHILKRLMSQRNLVTESANGIKELLDTTNECLNALRNIGVDVTNWDIIVIHLICLKLDPETRKQWELKASEDSEDLPTFEGFDAFLERRFRALEFVEPKTFKNTTYNLQFNKNSNVQGYRSSTASAPRVHHATALSCSYCSEDHRIGHCKSFAKIDIDARRGFVQSNHLCFNCLGVNHSVFACRQSTRCRICKKKHHSLLHPKNTTSTTDSGVVNQSVEPSQAAHEAVSAGSSYRDESITTEVKSHFSTSRNQVLLATALVKAQSNSGKGITLRCLLDQGSQASLITESAVQLLGLKKHQHKSTISGLGSDEGATLASKSIVKVKIQSLLNPNFEYTVNAFVLNKLTSVLPEKRVVVELWSEFKNINLADPFFEKPDKIDLLLGADVYCQILEEGIIKGSPGAVIAQKTTLGWILSGPISKQHSTTSTISVNHIHVENELLKRFWELEADTPVKSPVESYTNDEKRCEEIFKSTTKRDDTGRYIVKLPFKNEDPSCKYGFSEGIAIRRLMQLEKRFARNAQLKARYSEVIKEYLDLGHMEKVTGKDRLKSDVVYLPHHAVIREDKTTSKVRVVFDASCPGTNGVSLNQDLLVGPTLQPDLRHIILRWRTHPICLVADIVKMYRQVKVDDADAEFQRIVWRDKPEDVIDHYKLMRVTFGTASAPYLAVRALHQVAYDEGHKFPLAAGRVLNHFYVDDLLTGCETANEGKSIYQELNSLLDRGGFELQKWTTNNKDLMQEFNKEKGEVSESLHLKIDITTNILGLTWNRNSDQFEYTVQLPPVNTPVTKRKVISDIARLFDPLGWLAPVVISAKIFIQKLWLSGIEWDDEVPMPLLKDWLTYRETLSQLTRFRLPRWIHSSSSDATMELQGFCDASSEAYAAVVYARIVDKDGNVHVSLITSKTKVAPIKQVSIPRLELCGAVLLTKLLKEVSEVMSIDKMNMHAWTDSTIVLSWLNSRPNRWKTFVANRVSEIITSLEPHQWSHVGSKDNPADGASRGTYQSVDELLWKEGPTWLKQKVISYKRIIVKETKLEEKVKNSCLVNTCGSTIDAGSSATDILSRFSSLRKTIRVIAVCMRIFKARRKESFSKWLTSQELRKSLMLCIRLVQQEQLSDEIASLKRNQSINKKSKLTSLNPFLDEEDIMRVGGRLQHAQITEEMKHPIILPHKSHFTNLVVANAHQKTLHGAPQLMLNHLRSKYWIVGAKNLVNLFVRKCVICTRYAASNKHPLMGQLPSARGTVSRAFLHSGVDYAGPINIRTTKGRGHQAYKGYICLFICMATRAIHLEAVSDMTSQGFLAAFKRFEARRGHCTDLWSDNGTNFVGAARELKQLFANEKSSMLSEIADHLATNETNWHFNPPHSPNFGGLWEAGIKSTKYHLKRVVGNSTLTYEEMATVLSQVEACLNSRPISRTNDNCMDPMPLTPGHFLVGEPLVLAPDYNYYETDNVSSLRRWQLTQRMVQDFWRRWSREYLTQFYNRYKWTHQTPEPAVGDIVLVKEEDLPPAKWLYGIITDKHTGLDGITRVVTLKCKGSKIKRSVGKLCILPIDK